MESDSQGPKLIFVLLDLLLVIGAVTGVLTIDGGRWLISNPAFYQAPEEGAAVNINSAAYFGGMVIPETGNECLPSPQPAYPDADEALLMLRAYHNAFLEDHRPAGTAVAMNTCE